MDLSLRKHEFNVFPLMNEDEMASLIASMESVGYVGEPILLYEGEILDGWNRYQATIQLGIEAPMEDFAGTRMEALLESIRRNQDRRHMNPGQMACVAVRNEELVKGIGAAVDEERRKKQAETQSGGGLSDKNLSDSVDDQSTRTNTKIGEMFGVSRESIRMARYVHKWDLDLFIDVLNNTDGMKLFRAYQQVRDARKLDQEAEEADDMHYEYDKKQREEEVDRVEEEYDPRAVTIRDREEADPMDFDLDEEESEGTEVIKPNEPEDVNLYTTKLANRLASAVFAINDVYKKARDYVAPELQNDIANTAEMLRRIINGEKFEEENDN